MQISFKIISWYDNECGYSNKLLDLAKHVYQFNIDYDLVVDSGSTKTDWIALDNEGEEIFSTQTLGLNPQMLSNEILNERIKNNFDFYKNRKLVNKLFFYGAGCGVKITQNRILKVFKSIFVNSEFDIKEDTYAAVYSAVDKGSSFNCKYYWNRF